MANVWCMVCARECVGVQVSMLSNIGTEQSHNRQQSNLHVFISCHDVHIVQDHNRQKATMCILNRATIGNCETSFIMPYDVHIFCVVWWH